MIDPTPARSAVERSLRAIDASGRPELWISRRSADELVTAAGVIDAAVHAGIEMPLAGTTVAVKDNIDVAGVPTTAGTPRPLHLPDTDAGVVGRLVAAGAVVIGKTTLDQFATGLVGTRTPYGIPCAAGDPERISGGSSSGSAVAVALGLVDVALGTDTAGSGRVPAAFNDIVGLKPTLGLLPMDGVYPASPSYDTVSVFARDLPTATAALGAMTAGGSPRPWSRGFRLAPAHGRVGYARSADLTTMTSAWRHAYDDTVNRLRDSGIAMVEIDVSDLLDAARLLYDGTLLAERAAAFGPAIEALGADADPVVAGIVLPAARFRAVDLVRDQQTLVGARQRAQSLLDGLDAVVLPTAPGHPTIADVVADPVRVNAWVGTFTNFVNLLDLSAVAVPAVGSSRAEPFGVTFVGPAHHDLVLAAVAATAGLADPVPTGTTWAAPTVDLVVFGAHRTGQPLQHELRSVGAVLRGQVRTAPQYRMAALATTPPKPGVWRCERGGRAVVGERWTLPADGFATFATGLAAPMALGRIRLDDGTDVLGFTCEPGALDGAVEIIDTDDWVVAVTGARPPRTVPVG